MIIDLEQRRIHSSLVLPFLLLLLLLGTDRVESFSSRSYQGRPRRPLCTSNNSNSNSHENNPQRLGASTVRDSTSPPPPPARHPKESQIRKESPHRRPRHYWTNISNVEIALRDVWHSHHVTIDPILPPPIPNECLLNYWNRYDLRGAIATHGGREFLSELLGGAPILPGRWKDAVQTRYVQELLQADVRLSADGPPPSPQQQQQQQQQSPPKRKKESTDPSDSQPARWSHSSHRKPKGYWSSLTVVVTEM